MEKFLVPSLFMRNSSSFSPIDVAPERRGGAFDGDSVGVAVAALWRDDWFDTAVFVALIAGLAWAPFWLGGDRLPAWGVNGLLFPALAILLEVKILLTGARHPISVRRIAGPAILFLATLAWIALQTMTELPASLAHPIWSMAGDLLERPIDGSISVNRGETSVGLIRLATAASVFWVTAQLTRAPLRARLLLLSIAGAVAAYSVYGLVLSTFFSGAIPFFDVPVIGFSIRSTFVNRNSFATYAGLGLVTTIGLTLKLFSDAVPQAAGSRSYRLSKYIEATGRRGWLLLGTGFVILVALLGTASRGGILATALGVFGLFALTVSRRRRHRAERVETIVFVTAALGATFLFFGDMIVGRIETDGLTDASRFSVYAIAIRAMLDRPLVGFGYGTFADIFPMYRDQSIATAGVWDMAHDAYLEAWLGPGLLFGSALIIAIGWLALKCFFGALDRRKSATPAIVASACSLIVGVHALVDFSIQIEGVALTYVALLGVGVAQAESSRLLVSD